jgi:hypothetical protein
MASEEERERATVYMEGLLEMRNDWVRESRPKGAKGPGPGRGKKPRGPGKPPKLP